MGGVKNKELKKKAQHVYTCGAGRRALPVWLAGAPWSAPGRSLPCERRSGGGSGGKGPAVVDKRNQELACPHCDRTFKQARRAAPLRRGRPTCLARCARAGPSSAAGRAGAALPRAPSEQAPGGGRCGAGRWRRRRGGPRRSGARARARAAAPAAAGRPASPAPPRRPAARRPPSAGRLARAGRLHRRKDAQDAAVRLVPAEQAAAAALPHQRRPGRAGRLHRPGPAPPSPGLLDVAVRATGPPGAHTRRGQAASAAAGPCLRVAACRGGWPHGMRPTRPHHGPTRCM